MRRRHRGWWFAAVVVTVLADQVVAAEKETPEIIVDQFGWRPGDVKVAVFADPQKGQNAHGRFVPGREFEVRSTEGRVVLKGTLKPWKGGRTDEISGDRAWWADFTELKTPGRYVLHDPKNEVQSAAFSISDDVYVPVMKASMRTFYYQRCGVPIDRKYGGDWNRGPCHLVERSTRELVGDRPSGPRRDVSGGWHDAGDHNKYVPFLGNTMWELMTAYDLNPAAFRDDHDIPESGNGVPDILDELKWELDWLLKMQREDGLVHNRVATIAYNVGDGPHDDKQPYYVTPVTTWATGVFVAATAHGARLFREYETAFPGYAKRLLDASLTSWKALGRHPGRLPADGKDGAGKTAAAGADEENRDGQIRLLAAAELFKTTRDDAFRDYVDRHYRDAPAGGFNPITAGWVDPLNGADVTRAMVVYGTSPGHTSRVGDEFRAVLRKTLKENFLDKRDDDPYRSWMIPGHYCWGSNSSKSRWGQLPLFGILLAVDPAEKEAYRKMSAEFLHYLHGRNALSLVYLTNMGSRGAKLGVSRSVMEIYHGWFHDGSPLYDGPGSKFGPAPGFLAGGPNQFFGKSWIAPPYGEPPAKAFKEWNTAWNGQHKDTEDSWAITEPAIYYQAAYNLLLSPFVGTKNITGGSTVR